VELMSGDFFSGGEEEVDFIEFSNVYLFPLDVFDVDGDSSGRPVFRLHLFLFRICLCML